MYRDNTKLVKIGDKVIGNGNKILIQSMITDQQKPLELKMRQENIGFY